MRFLRMLCSIVIAMLLLTSCRSPRRVDRGFYYWKSHVNLNSDDLRTFNKLNVKRIYIKLFDVVWNEEQRQAVPVAEARFATRIPRDFAVIPTVYITNETLKKLSSEDMPHLAGRIRHKVLSIMNNAGIYDPDEFQVDCDWTLQTREKYFELLRSLRKDLGTAIHLTATIRLHQIKYMERTGIPPVDRGILMAYNLESPADLRTKNSIIHFETAKAYLDRLGDYPLPLEIALPLYSLGAVFQGDRLMGLIADLTSAELEKSPDFVPSGSHRYRAMSNTYLRGVPVYKNDHIRIDESDIQETLKVATYISQRLSTPHTRVILFDYNPQRIREVHHAPLEALYRSLR